MIPVDSLDDPRLAPYRNMKDKDLARHGQRFIAEGEQVVRRLLASPLAVESVLLSQRKAAALTPLAQNRTAQIFVASDPTIHQILGFEFHSGVMACGLRPPSATLDALAAAPSPRTVVVCPKITNPDNLGAIIRVAAGFGTAGMILGEQCCDPYFRHSIRVSMGSVFRLPIMQSLNLSRDLDQLRRQWNFQLTATVLSTDAQPVPQAGRSENLAILFGGEADGLDQATIDLCDTRVTIPMRRGTDSLNVAVAAGIFLYHFVDVLD